MEQHDGRAGAAVAAVIGDDGPEVAASGGFPARVQHRRTRLVDKDTIRTAQMGAHMVDDLHQVEAGAADLIAEQRAAIKLDPLPPEDLGLTDVTLSPKAIWSSRFWQLSVRKRRLLC